jgi:hypothetical protein
MTGNITLGTNTIDGLAINVSATSNIGLGTGAVDAITTGNYNIALGKDALTATTSGNYNIALGKDALYSNTTGVSNTATGHSALVFNTTGASNTATGYEALYLNTTGANNTAVGKVALWSNTTGTSNTANGVLSLFSNTTSHRNTAVGVYSLYSNTTGGENVATGYRALFSNTTASNNTAVGRHAMNANTTGANNTALGYSAGDNITTGSSNIIIGASVDAASATASNQLNIGGWITGAAGAITVPGSLTTAGFTSTGIDDNATSTAITIDASENVLVGTTDDVVWNNSANSAADNGHNLRSDGRSGFAYYNATANANATVNINRTGSDGDLIRLFKSGTTVGSIGTTGSNLVIGTGDTGFRFFDGSPKGIFPASTSSGVTDGAIDLGKANGRFDDIYATNGTIQTSDRNEKQDIEELSTAETAVATACKGLMRKFRWQDAVAEKGDDARIHFGIIAQDLQDAFTAEGLDAGRYAMFISSTWYEKEVEVPAVEAVEAVEATYDDEGAELTPAVEAVEAKDAYTRTDTEDEPTDGYTERTRLGVRYPELLAFIISAI